MEKSIDILQLLKSVKISQNEAEYILEELLNEKILNYKLNKGNFISENIKKRFFGAIKRRENEEPIAYIFKRKFFYKNYFLVSKSCLIPRQDSEILIDNALNLLDKFRTNKKLCILDICSGSGCIGLSFAKEVERINKIPVYNLTLFDISKRALNISKKNATKLGINEGKIEFIQGDILKEKYIPGKKFDIIFYNPPYIKRNEILKYDEQLKYEPTIALDGGKDGLNFYKKLPFIVEKLLEKDGYIFIEIGFSQTKEILEIIKNITNINYKIEKDLSKNDRMIMIEKL